MPVITRDRGFAEGPGKREQARPALWVMLRESNVRLAANLSKYYMLGVGEQHLPFGH